MRTPKSYTDNLKAGIITKDMLLDCLYSCSKRAKNFRDKEREIREETRARQYFNHYYYDKYNNEQKARDKKKEYYRQKELLLSVLSPVCIHKEFSRYERIRIYDYDKEYKKNRKKFIWENCYLDKDAYREVWFGDIEDKNKPVYNYYLFYDIGGEHTFHTPIFSPDKYPDLEVVQIDKLDTYGYDIAELVSNQFVAKVASLIQSGDYTLQL